MIVVTAPAIAASVTRLEELLPWNWVPEQNLDQAAVSQIARGSLRASRYSKLD